MRRYHGGSRSPRGGRKWISKAIAKMARYEENRPRGFHVDDEGGFKLSNLLSTWRGKSSLTEEVILHELEKNSMRRNGEFRFLMRQEVGGDTTIWVKDARCANVADHNYFVEWQRRSDREDLEYGGSSSAQLQPTSGNVQAAETQLDQLDKAVLATQAQHSAARGAYLEPISLRLCASDPLCLVSAPSAARPRPSSRRPRPSQTPKPPTVDLTGVDEPKGVSEVPGPPPGKHWTMFNDYGDSWWFYEGPKGTWWTSSEHHNIRRWTENS
jgi:hypothetical protein